MRTFFLFIYLFIYLFIFFYTFFTFFVSCIEDFCFIIYFSKQCSSCWCVHLSDCESLSVSYIWETLSAGSSQRCCYPLQVRLWILSIQHPSTVFSILSSRPSPHSRVRILSPSGFYHHPWILDLTHWYSYRSHVWGAVLLSLFCYIANSIFGYHNITKNFFDIIKSIFFYITK